MTIRRTSYLRSRQPRAARWAPHEADGWHSRPFPKRGAQVPTGTAQAPARQRPHTATTRRRAPANGLDSSSFTPLLSGPEVEFLFGKTDRGATTNQPPPSLRKTTLGRLLRRTTSSNTDENLLRQTTEDGSPYSRRPTSAETCLLSGSGRRDRGGFKPAWDAISVAKKKVTPRPSTAATKGGRGRPSSAKEGSMAGSTAGLPDGRKKRTSTDSRTPGTPRTSSKEIAEPKSRDTVLTTNSSARNHLASGRGVTARTPLEGFTARERGNRPAMSLNQALDATLAETIGTVSPLEQFVNARKTVAEMKQINTKDSTGDILLCTQVSLSITPQIKTQACFNENINSQYFTAVQCCMKP